MNNQCLSVTGWIFEEQLQPLLITVGYVAGYNIDPYNFDAVEYGLNNTSEAEDRWFDYTFYGQTTLSFRIARNQEDRHIIHYILQLTERKAQQWEMADFMLSRSVLKPG